MDNVNTSNNDTQNEQNKNEQNNKKKGMVGKIIAVLILIIIIILLLLRSCGKEEPYVPDTPVIEAPVGDFEVDDKREEPVGDEVQTTIPNITFSGYGEYTVSEDRPNLELKNSEVNFVDMVFEVIDAESGEVIARTPKVEAGKYIYVDVYKYYADKGSGTYRVNVNISTYVAESRAEEFGLTAGAQMNGMNEEMKLIVE